METPGRHPGPGRHLGDTKETPGRHPGDTWGSPEITWETPGSKRHLGARDTWETPGSRVAGVGKLSASAKNAFNSFVGRVFANSRPKRCFFAYYQNCNKR